MSNEIHVVSNVSKNISQQEQMYETLVIPEQISLNKKPSVSIASTDYLHRINIQLMQISQLQHDAIINNLIITQEQLVEQKQEIDQLKKHQSSILQEIEQFNKTITDQFNDIQKNTNKLTAYFKKYGLLTNQIETQTKQDDMQIAQSEKESDKQVENIQQTQQQLQQLKQLQSLLDF